MDDLSIPSRHGITYGALRQLGIDLAQLKKYFRRLIDLQPPVLRIIRIENGSIRYGFIDHLLSNFVQECELILSNALTRMEASWRFRGRMPKTREVKWYRSLLGRRRKDEVFSRCA